MMPLSFALKDTPYRIARVAGTEKVRARLGHLGFVENSSVVVRQVIDGSVIAEVKGTRLALDKKMAQKIQVQEERL